MTNTMHPSTHLARIPLALLVLLLAIPMHGIRAATIDTVGIYRAIDLRVPYSEAGIPNVWDDATLGVTLTSPTGRILSINGFHHSWNLWAARFAPDEMGLWKYSATLSLRDPVTTLIDSFYVTNSSERGFIRQHPNNPKRWIYSRDGGIYAGLGFGDCLGNKVCPTSGTAGMDGGYRPKGYHEGIGWSVPYQQYILAYGDEAGFNLYRYSDANCAYSIIKNISTDGNDYDTLHSLWTDTLFDSLRAHGFRIYMTILAGPRGASNDANAMAATERYVQYCIDRYGALVDFWELTNESNPDSLWVSEVATYIQQHDPYHHLVSMSNPLPLHPAIDIISPHWYGKEAARSSDVSAEQNINQYATI